MNYARLRRPITFFGQVYPKHTKLEIVVYTSTLVLSLLPNGSLIQLFFKEFIVFTTDLPVVGECETPPKIQPS